MQLKSFLFLLQGCLLSLTAFSQSDWTIKKEGDGIKVYVLKSANSGFDEVKVECDCIGRVSQLAGVLTDISDHVKWVYSTDTAYLLKQISPSELYYYTIVKSPWPVENRDLAVHLTLSQDPRSKVLTIEADDVPGYFPKQKNLVRVPFSKATWKVTPIGTDSLHIEYKVQVNPGGNIPAWLTNLFAAKAPYESFGKLKQRLTLPKYNHPSLPFITD
jgi:START domain